MHIFYLILAFQFITCLNKSPFEMDKSKTKKIDLGYNISIVIPLNNEPFQPCAHYTDVQVFQNNIKVFEDKSDSE